MEEILKRLKDEGDKAMLDLIKIQEFDFEKATEEELEAFNKFIAQKMEYNQKLQQQLKKVVKDLKEKEGFEEKE
jgi:histidinol dehydrogenase